MTDRLTREKEYHNSAFSEGIRKDADKYYTIHQISFKKLSDKLKIYGTDKDVLEYGCGPGSHSFILANYARKVHSVDISDFAITNARLKAEKDQIKNLFFEEMNAEELRYENDSFDMIYGNAIIHHLDLSKAFAEINRVLKPGGRAFFYEPLGHNFIINLYRKMTPRMRTIDEHPLLMSDIRLAKKSFPSVQVSYYHLTTLLAVPFRGMKRYKAILTFFHKMDSFLFKIFPFLKRNAWYCIIEIEKPNTVRSPEDK